MLNVGLALLLTCVPAGAGVALVIRDGPQRPLLRRPAGRLIILAVAAVPGRSTTSLERGHKPRRRPCLADQRPGIGRRVLRRRGRLDPAVRLGRPGLGVPDRVRRHRCDARRPVAFGWLHRRPALAGGRVAAVRICMVGGIFDKDGIPRVVRARPRRSSRPGSTARGHTVETRGHWATGAVSFDIVHVHHLGPGALACAANPAPARFVFTQHAGRIRRRCTRRLQDRGCPRRCCNRAVAEGGAVAARQAT